MAEINMINIFEKVWYRIFGINSKNYEKEFV